MLDARAGAAAKRGYSLLEVLVSLAILLSGVVSIVWFFPQTLQARQHAAFVTESAVLAQMKSEEIRRDDDSTGTLVTLISERAQPTDPIPFAQQPRLSYAFCGRSIMYDETDSPRADSGVARVIVVKTERPDPATVRPQDVIYELRFAH